MQQSEFNDFMDHFIKHSYSSKANPTLLLLDNHTSHLSIAAIDKAIDNGITMLTFPPHCTHRLQPLDNGFFSPVKIRYGVKHDAWMKLNGGKKFEFHRVAPVVEKCLEECGTIATIKSAFENTGVCEFNPNRFTDDDYAAAKLIAEAEARANMTEEELAEQGLDRVLLLMEDEIPTGSFEEVASNEDVASTSTAFNQDDASTSTAFNEDTASTSSSMNLNLNLSGPVRIVGSAKKSNRGRKPMKSCVLTTPEKRDELYDAAEKRNANKRKKEEKGKNPPVKRGPKKKEAQKKKAAPKPRGRPKKQKIDEKDESSGEEQEDRDFCKICRKLMPKKMNKNNTIECDTCKRPFHARCAFFQGASYTCDDCEESD